MSHQREERVVLVDPDDRPVGEAEKLAAHEDGGKLHRAFSIFIENERGEQLLQQRAATKYHFRGLWANACCGHPRPGEELASAARRRLREELGIDVALEECFTFQYIATDAGSGLTERELDHVLLGRFDGLPQPHPDEIDRVRWVAPEALEREMEARPDAFAPWFREAAPRVLASRAKAPGVRGGLAARRRRRLFGVFALLLVAFVATVILRTPWRGHFAEGDPYGTAQGFRWLRTWNREGAWATRFQLVLSPPTAEYEGENELVKWALPGHLMLVHAVFWLLRMDTTVDGMMQVNLAIHLVLALLLALLAHYLATLARPGSLGWPTWTALHCGLFALLFPPLLYWGQNFSCQYFTALPLLVVVAGGRWLRASLATEKRRRRADRAVALAVFFGTLTDFLFWLLVPCLLLARGYRAWKGRPRTSDPWKRTLLFPYAAAVIFLFALFVVNGQVLVMLDRALSWTLGDRGGGAGGLVSFLATRMWFFGRLFGGHFADAFNLLGVLALALAAWKLAPRPRFDSGAVPWAARGVLLDLLVPTLLFSFVLSPHQAVHTYGAMPYAPFMAVAWTFLVPFVLDGIEMRRRWKRAAWLAYGVLAFLVIWPRLERLPALHSRARIRLDAGGRLPPAEHGTVRPDLLAADGDRHPAAPSASRSPSAPCTTSTDRSTFGRGWRGYAPATPSRSTDRARRSRRSARGARKSSLAPAGV